jgi:hypothetical protein
MSSRWLPPDEHFSRRDSVTQGNGQAARPSGESRHPLFGKALAQSRSRKREPAEDAANFALASRSTIQAASPVSVGNPRTGFLVLVLGGSSGRVFHRPHGVAGLRPGAIAFFFFFFLILARNSAGSVLSSMAYSRRRLTAAIPRISVALVVLMLFVLMFSILWAAPALAQGGPPYYTNDPGTPGHLNWEINLGYMPFFYKGQSVSHVPDLDINFGVGERIQLTYENAWLRVQNRFSPTQYGLGQSNPGVKWRFYDAGEGGLSVSVFPQAFLNNPNDAVRRGITPPSEAFLLPVEFSKKLGPVDVDLEVGYAFEHKAPDGWITGLVVGHDFTPKLELDAEFYSQGPFHLPDVQPTFDLGGRYRIHSPVILLFMAGRSFEPARSNQPYFVGYFGLQFLLPPKSYNRE